MPDMPSEASNSTFASTLDASPEISSRGLASASFLGLIVTQWLTVMNDNIFRWLAVGIAKQYVDPKHESFVLSLGTIAFVAPYILLAAPAGYLADRFSKKNVIVVCKLAEIALMALAMLTIWMGNLVLLFGVLALMGAQAALFSPAKMGSIPEMLPSKRISAANGCLGLVTVVSTVLGAAAGNWLTDATGAFGRERMGLSASILLGVAVVGWLASHLIARAPAAAPHRRFPWNAVPETWRDLQALGADRAILRVALGIMFFWSLGALAQLNIDRFAFEQGAFLQTQVAPLLGALALGVGIGSVLAGVWSGGRIELGIVPLGGIVIAVSSALLFFVRSALIVDSPFFTAAGGAAGVFTASYVWALVLLGMLGIGAGMFDVPLESYLQHRSPAASRGSILAASNFLTFAGILVMSVVFAGLRAPLRAGGAPLLDSRQIFLACGILTLPVVAYIVWLIPQASIRFFVWLASKSIYRIRIHGLEQLPAEGGALLVCNHVSWLDGFLLLLTSSRPVRTIAWTGPLQGRVVQSLANLFGTIPIDPLRPKSIIGALKTAREAVLRGELVLIFPEGSITRTGQLLGFRPGLLRIVKDTDIPVIPVYLDGLWGSIFSFSEGKFFWKRPRRWPYPVDIHFGSPLTGATDISEVRRAVGEIGTAATIKRIARMPIVTRSFIRSAKNRKRISKVADSTGADLSGGETLLRSLVLRRILRRGILAPDETHVGVLLPPSAGGVVVNAALALDRRVSVNLNYTVSSESLNKCLELANVKHVLTSRKFWDKMNFDLKAEIVFLEDFKDRATLLDKVIAGLQAFALPASWIEWSLGLHRVQPDDVMTIIFTSGSTGTPKGVMLTYANVGSNVEAIEQVVHLHARDVVIGILPFFHSMGFTVTLWTVLALNVKGVYHFNPLDARQIGKLCHAHQGTVLLSTPTFLRGFLRRVEREEFATLNVVVAGAEKLPKDLSDAFEEKFRVRPAEGYGTTELSPLVSVNVPASRSLGSDQIDRKEGTVGRPVPGVSARVVDLESGQPLPTGKPGMLWISGPNVMKGYLHRPDLTAAVIRDGWYVTGDIAVIDEDGFISITGRESRFSKIGGEMVPHIQIEEMLNRIIGAGEDAGLQAVVTAVPDPKKGERLIVVHKPLNKTPAELQQALIAAGLPNLYIPSPDSYLQVDELPILGSGKLDLKGVKQIALDRVKSDE